MMTSREQPRSGALPWAICGGLLLAAFGFLAAARKATAASIAHYDHTAILVHDLERSAAFYESLLGLARIPEPFHDGRHIWLQLGDHEQLHIVKASEPVAPLGIDHHMAFRVASLDSFMAQLDQRHITYRSFRGEGKIATRPDGVRQIYCQDPDGYWIEVNDGHA